MQITYKINTPITAEQVSELFIKSGINRPSDDLPRIRKMLDNSNLIITAWSEEKIVGIARSLTDFCYCCYLSDLAVDIEFQKSGIGKELINRTREAITDQSMLLLLSAPLAMDYYPKVDFERTDKAFIINRKGI
ncbi:MAG: GNAT family N-acetyltransferase [Ignavibacteria bacterium]